MRNLKKILALVLALVMSFSLMATASAFSDDGDIAADYAEAIDVLSGLEVFKGYDNGATFQPKGSITRAEVAAIIYRIATGDVKDAQTSIYSSWGQFNDVKDGSWYAGYVNYCANAGYIKGYDSKTFGPNDPVTGYQALAMILRAIGYDKNNEFTGSNWQVRTASIAKQRGITDNIVDTLLGQSATREVVAEILFQSILVKTVTFNTNTLSYSENATSLGYDVLKLERLEGVVVANQYADLADDEGMATGKTRIETADGDRTLNVVTTLDDIGESRYVYGIKTSNNGYNLVTEKLYDTGDNVIADKGEEIKVKDLAKEQSISVNDDTEYFINFSQATDKWTSDYLIRYVIAEDELNTAEKEFMAAQGANASKRDYDFPTTDEDGKDIIVTKTAWIRTIKAENEFDSMDKILMKRIFDNADRWYNYDTDTTIRRYALGEVYVGTTSLKDYSDTMSWKGFREEYINEDLGDFDKTTNGNYLKLVDNNNDGMVEYALRTDYVMDEVVGINTKNDEDTYFYNGLTTDDDVVTPDGGEVKFALNDVIIYAEIDGKCYAEVVTPVTATIKAKNFKDVEVTAADDTVYGQSNVGNATDKEDEILDMDQQVEYNLYIDKFGFVRLYELAQGSQYGLLTEIYPTRNFNGAYVRDGAWIAELMTGNDKAPAEYDILNAYNGRVNTANLNPFIRAYGWSVNNASTDINHKLWENNIGWRNMVNYLQEAIAHLDLDAVAGEEFDYQNTNEPAPSYTSTNVAKYTKTETGVNLYSASEYAYEGGARLYYADPNNDGTYERYTRGEYDAKMLKDRNFTVTDTWFNAHYTTDVNSVDADRIMPVYASDYIQLDIESIKAGANHYNASAVYPYGFDSYVNAVDDTEIYIVSSNTIQHFTGYKNMPAISAADIYTMYAVAKCVENDRNDRDYWVADVIVIEVDGVYAYDRIDLVFENRSVRNDRASVQAVNNGNRYLQVVDSEDANVDTLVPDYSSWNGNYSLGFYGVYDSENVDSNTIAGSVDYITSNFNDNGVYAAVVERVRDIDRRGLYIDLTNGKTITVSDPRILAVGRTNSSNPWSTIAMNRTEVKPGDELIYVKYGSDVDFVIDLSYVNDRSSSWRNAGQGGNWLDVLFGQILTDQNNHVDSIHITPMNDANGNGEIDRNEVAIDNFYLRPNYMQPEYLSVDDYMDGNELVIPASFFEPTANADYTFQGLFRLVMNDQGVVVPVQITNVKYVNNQKMYVITDNIWDVELAPLYTYNAPADGNMIALVDINGQIGNGAVEDAEDVGIFHNMDARPADPIAPGDALNTGIIRLALGREAAAWVVGQAVEVSFEVRAGYDVTVMLTANDGTAVTHTALSFEDGRYSFRYNLKASGVKIVITATQNSDYVVDGTYRVSLDTNAMIVGASSKTYTKGGNVSFTVRVNSDYVVNPDANIYTVYSVAKDTVVGSAQVAVSEAAVAGDATKKDVTITYTMPESYDSKYAHWTSNVRVKLDIE